MRFVLWVTFILLLIIMWGREVSVYVQARKEKMVVPRELKRFKRRTIGLLLLFVLALMFDLSNLFDHEAGAQVDPALLKFELVYYGLFFVVLIILLVIAGKDFRDVAETYVEDEQQMTMQTLVEMKHEMQVRDPDNLPIPGIDFDETNKDKEENRES